MPTITEIAAAYANLPDTTNLDDLLAWQTAARFFADRALDFRKGNVITITDDPDPYPDATEQARDMLANRFTVSTAYSDHPYWSVGQNVDYRIVHDMVGHMPLANDPTNPDNAPAFNVAGELHAWRQQLDDMVRHGASPTVIDVAYCETMGQLAFAAVTGDFLPRQKAGILPFNPFDTIRDDR